MKNLIYLAILTTAAVLSWIGFSVYNSYTTSTINQDTAIEITPIPGKFDNAVIDKLKSKTFVQVDLGAPRANVSLTPAPLQIPEGSGATPSAKPTPAASPTITSTPSAQIKL